MNTFEIKRLFIVWKKSALACMPVLFCLVANPVLAGPFAPAAGQAGSDAVIWSSPSIVAWATGYQNYVVGANVDATWQTPQKAFGVAGNSDGNNEGFNYDILCLGNGGRVTLTFAQPIKNGSGADFVVFENSFGDTFLELAFVEVSSDGVNFTRYPNFSFTASAVSGYGVVDPTNISGYASKYRGGYGTPFDLDLLAGTPGLDINAITHVKLIDIVGGTVYDSYPAQVGGPHLIYDPTPTTGSGGLDLDAIGVIHQLASPPYSPPNGPFPLNGYYSGSIIRDSAQGL